jgi:hypothetical protein
MLNLNDLKNEIKNIAPEHPVLIYIGVGAAAYSHPLPLEHYHQFPPFLQDMRNQLANLHLFLVLIDPQQESPPMVARDNDMLNQSQTHYSSLEGQLQTFIYRHSVYTDPDIHVPANALNITQTLRDLNQFAKENQVSLVYHDFTGRRTALLAEYFDNELKEHLDQLIYGMSAREDHGCFFDLTQANAYMPFRLERQPNTRPLIKMFNYYKHIVNNTYAELERDIKQYPEEMHRYADLQRNQIIQIIHTQFKNTNLSLLRQMRHIILEPIQDIVPEPIQDIVPEPIQDIAPEPIQDIAPEPIQDIYHYIFNDLPSLYRRMFTDLYKEKEYNLLYELLFNYTASELDILSKLKQMVMTGEEILTFITLNEDPYKWHNAINGIML